jgi:hypothetical protein
MDMELFMFAWQIENGKGGLKVVERLQGRSPPLHLPITICGSAVDPAMLLER